MKQPSTHGRSPSWRALGALASLLLLAACAKVDPPGSTIESPQSGISGREADRPPDEAPPPRPSASPTASEIPGDWQVPSVETVEHFSGSIDERLTISMTLEQTGSEIRGRCKYVGNETSLYLSGGVSEAGEWRFHEYLIDPSTGEADTTGHIVARRTRDRLLGTWSSPEGSRTYPFEGRSSLRPDAPRLDFRTACEDCKGLLNRILILERGSETVLGTVDSFDADPPGHRITAEDMNFDGYLDFRVIEFLPAGANLPQLCWVYDPGSKTFARSSELEALVSPRFDGGTKEILSRNRIHAARYEESVYRYVSGELARQRTTVTEYKADGTPVRTVIPAERP